MSETKKHTPGPWEASMTDDELFGPEIEGPNGEYIAQLTYNGQSLQPRSLGHLQADANLIAAAPDLLAALEALYAETVNLDDSYADDGDGYVDAWQSSELERAVRMARRAIRKARGE